MAILVKIYGERNTNTNYLSELIRLNLAVEELPGVVPTRIKKLQTSLPGNEWLRDAYFMLSYGHNLGWKHAAVDWARAIKTPVYQNNQVAMLTLTKNPYAWLLSLYKRPYHQYYDSQPTFSEFIHQPWKTVRRDNMSSWLANPVQLWNEKNKSYLQPAAPAQVLRLKTEDTLADPEGLVRRIAALLGVQPAGEFSNVSRSTKDNKKDFNYYRDYYLNERWAAELPDDSVAFINRELDRDVMDHYGYAYRAAD